MRFAQTIFWIGLALLFGGAGYWIPAYFRAVDPVVLEIAAEERPDRTAVAESLLVGGYPDAARFLVGNEPAEGERSDAPATAALLSLGQRAEAMDRLRESDLEGVRRLLPEIPREPDPTTPAEARITLLPLRIGGILTADLAEDRQLRPALLGNLVTWATSEEPSEAKQWDTFAQQVAVWGSTAPPGALGQTLAAFNRAPDFLALAELASPPEALSRTFAMRLLLEGAEPTALTEYLITYPNQGADDLRNAFAMGPGAVEVLLERSLPVHRESLLPPTPSVPALAFLTRFAYTDPELAVWVRTALVIVAFLCLFSALAPWLPNPGDRFLEKPGLLQTFVRRLILASISTAALLFTLEPSLFQQPETASAPSTASLSLSSITNPSSSPTMMNAISIDSVTLLILSIFLVLQLGLYVFCLVKLSEIRRQHIPDETKIMLLENEENLFDSGLYLGLGGTVASLILLAVGIVEASLMAAYASTLFGILFVSFFKIFHLRPLKRRLILSASRAS